MSLVFCPLLQESSGEEKDSASQEIFGTTGLPNELEVVILFVLGTSLVKNIRP